jgi:zinc D-Ala-D-Ala carboxypeptidase
MTRISKHFTLRELTYSQTAERNKIDNTPPPAVVENLKALCDAVLEPLRATTGPITITSGYRAPAVNKIIGGNSRGQHPLGQAVDMECFSMSTRALAERVIELKLPFDQLIMEFASAKDPNAGWVHVSHKKEGGNRGQILRAERNAAGKTVYLPGLT